LIFGCPGDVTVAAAEALPLLYFLVVSVLVLVAALAVDVLPFTSHSMLEVRGPLPRWHCGRDASACLPSSVKLVRVRVIERGRLPHRRRVARAALRTVPPNAVNRLPWLLSFAWHCSHVPTGLPVPSALVWQS
jgi:hypothetical protein